MLCARRAAAHSGAHAYARSPTSTRPRLHTVSQHGRTLQRGYAADAAASDQQTQEHTAQCRDRPRNATLSGRTMCVTLRTASAANSRPSTTTVLATRRAATSTSRASGVSSASTHAALHRAAENTRFVDDATSGGVGLLTCPHIAPGSLSMCAHADETSFRRKLPGSLHFSATRATHGTFTPSIS